MSVDEITARTARVAVLGQGYVGLVLSMRASEAGFDVVGFDVDSGRVAALREGRSFIEDVPDDVLTAALDRGYVATDDASDLAGFDVAVISVPTPLRERIPDLTFIESATAAIAPHLRRGALVVLESTTYPGTTEAVVGTALERLTGLVPGDDFLLSYSPERIDPGNPRYGLANTPKIVAGIDRASLDAADAFFSAFVETTVRVSTCRTAELAKLLENTFRHVNIAMVNEVAVFARALEVDVFEAIDAAATKPFGFMRFTPGPGVGGHCLPIDPTYLSWSVEQTLGQSFRFVELANEINDQMPHYVVRRAVLSLNEDRKAMNGARVTVLGLAYKPNVGDSRESPAAPIVRELHELGADLTLVDPHTEKTELAGRTIQKMVTDDSLDAADLVIIVTDHDAFDYEQIAARAPRILDTRDRMRSVAPGRAVIDSL